MLSERRRKAAGNLFLRSLGWRLETASDSFPDRCVLIAAPHTSNLDLPLTLAVAAASGVHIRWVGKHTLFTGARGRLMRALGGVPVERHHRTNFVDQMAGLFEKHDKLVLLVASEGTRSYTEHWKSGFYHIARLAQVPVMLGFLDYGRRRGGFGPSVEITGDVKTDMDQIRAFYSGMKGLWPSKFGPIRLRSEMDSANSTNSANPMD